MKALKLTLFIISTLLITNLMAQTKPYFEYTYDAAGNRTNRKYITLYGPRYNVYDSTKTKNSDSIKEQPIVYKDKIGNSDIKIYPNPTHNVLNIEVTNGVDDADALIGIYDQQGRIVEEFRGLKTMNTLDFKSKAPGMYIIRIISDGKKTEWKVMKE